MVIRYMVHGGRGVAIRFTASVVCAVKQWLGCCKAVVSVTDGYRCS